MDSNKDYMNMSLDQIIEKRRSQSLKNGRRNEKIRNRTAIRKKSDLMIQTKANPAICVRMNGNNRPRPTPAIEASNSSLSEFLISSLCRAFACSDNI